MSESPEQEVSEKSNLEMTSYNKKSPFMWIVIYAVIGLLVYGAIYYFAFYKKGNTSYTKQTQNTAVSPSAEGTEGTAQEPSTPEINLEIKLTEDGFSPKEVTVKVGTIVTWKNESGVTATVNSAPHPAHTDYPRLNLGTFVDGNTLTLVFDTPGTYKYHNHLNSTQFGTVIVE